MDSAVQSVVIGSLAKILTSCSVSVIVIGEVDSGASEVISTVLFLSFACGAPTRCSESDGRMIYGVTETITGMVLRRLENQGSLELSIYRESPGGTIEAKKICIVKHGGVTPINPAPSTDEVLLEIDSNVEIGRS
ncbi:unnamed protein product [Prunus brigantina]